MNCYFKTSLDWSDIMASKDYEKYLQFSRTKLMCHLMAFALHRRMILSKKNVTVNVIELGKEREPNNNGRMRTTSALSNSTSTLSMCRRAESFVHFIENPLFDRISGKYLDSTGKEIRSGAEATDERLQERLWTFTSDLCKEYI
uniref:Helitron_like_N domain-containing protein n=1 Tax=Heterorhabditis bacteriophora TaxID=37862 RepID=A0A1I7WCT8_HETBA